MNMIEQQAARIAELEAQVARDGEHYNAAMAMSEKHRRNWVEAAQRVAELEAERFADVYTAQMVEIAGHQYALRPNAAAEIAALREAKPKAKRLVFPKVRDCFGESAESAIGKFTVYMSLVGPAFWIATLKHPDAAVRFLGTNFATESEARAACQAEFDRIYAEMTESPMVTA